MNVIKAYFLTFLLSVMPMGASQTEPVVILGGGVGSLTSALYLGRAGISPLVIEGPTPGGLLTQSHSVQNWPGIMEIDGAQLVEKMHGQAEANGARFVNEEVIGVDFSKKPFVITTRTLDGKDRLRQIFAESCIVAMGTKPNFLKIPGEENYWGRGVTNCAICDGSLYKGKIVGVVGGGDAAVLEALYLANIAKEVHIFVRKNSLRATEEKRTQILKEKSNVQFHYETTVQEVQGNEAGVTGVVLQSKGKKAPFALDGLFLAIGSTPNTALFKNNLKLDSQGYIALEKDQQTAIKGVYAIGDIVDPVYKQAVSAAGDGAKAAMQVQQYLSDRVNLIAKQEVPSKPKASNQVVEIGSLEQFHKELSSGDLPMVIDFYATWCGPCKQISPALEVSAAQLEGKVKFVKVNVDQFSDLSANYNIRAMPTVLLIDASGKEVERKVGLEQIHDLLSHLQKKGTNS